MRILLIWNPTAGRGKARRHVVEAVAYLRDHGATVDVAASQTAIDLTRLAAAGSRADYHAVVIGGGDGSLNLALREFDVTRTPVGLLPFGSGNDFAQVCGIPRRLAAACDAILGGKTREIDLATANGIRYVGVAGMGFDSEVARYAAEKVRLLRGSAVYLYSILRVLPRFVPHPVRITADGTTSELEIMFAVIANTPRYGGGIRIAPDARPDDRKLDLCIIHRTSRFELLKTLPLAYRGLHVRNPFVETRRAESIRVEATSPLQVYADGEPLTSTPADFSLAAETLRMIVP